MKIFLAVLLFCGLAWADDISLPKDPAYQAALDKSNAVAKSKYPDAYTPGTPLNVQFVTDIHGLWKVSPESFNFPNWPETLAQQANLEVKIAIASENIKKSDAVIKSEFEKEFRPIRQEEQAVLGVLSAACSKEGNGDVIERISPMTNDVCGEIKKAIMDISDARRDYASKLDAAAAHMNSSDADFLKTEAIRDRRSFVAEYNDKMGVIEKFEQGRSNLIAKDSAAKERTNALEFYIQQQNRQDRADGEEWLRERQEQAQNARLDELEHGYGPPPMYQH